METDRCRSKAVNRERAPALSIPGRLDLAHHVAACRTEGLIQVSKTLPLLHCVIRPLFIF